MDAYLAAAVVPEYLILLLQAGIQFSLVPIIVKAYESAEQAEVSKLVDTMLASLLALFVLICGFSFVAAEQVAALLAPGFAGEQTELLARLLPFIVPGAFFRVAALVLASYFYAQRRFILPAAAPVLGALVQFGIVLLAVPDFRAEAAACAFVVNHVVQFGLLLAAYQKSRQAAFKLDFRLPLFGRALQAMWPLLFGAIFFRAVFLVDRFLASDFNAGSITRLAYATKIVIVMISTGASGFLTVMFPELSKLYAQKAWARLRAMNSQAIAILLFVSVFFCMVMVFSGDIWIKLFLQRGAFTSADTNAVAGLVVILSGMLICGAIGAHTANLFYASGDTRTPTVIAFLGFWFGTALKVVFSQKWTIYGIALATSMHYVVNAIAMMWLLQRKGALFDLRQMLFDGLRIGASALAAASVFYLMQFMTMWPKLIVAGFAILVAGTIYFAIASLLKLSVVGLLMRRFAAKLGRR